MTTIVTIANSAGAQAAGAALRNAGLGVVEVETLQAAQAAAYGSRDTVVLCDGQALASIGGNAAPEAESELPKDVRRVLSHELRTPLSAMAGWLHLLETGKLDQAGTRRAIEKLRGNIEDQVRTIERYLGANKEGHD
jgi:signal transduction histidine kinase